MFLGVAGLTGRNHIRQRVRAALTEWGNVVLGQSFHLAMAIDAPMPVGGLDFFPLRGGQVVEGSLSTGDTSALGLFLYPFRMLRVPVGMLLAHSHTVRRIVCRTLGIHQGFVLYVAGLIAYLFLRFVRLIVGLPFFRVFALPACDRCAYLVAIVCTILRTFLTFTQNTARSFAVAGVLVGTKFIERFQQIASTTDFFCRGFHGHLLTKVEVSTWLPTELAAET